MIRMPRLASAMLAGALVLSLAVGTTGSASAAPSDRTGRWLERQLTGGLIHNNDPALGGFDDYGLTADTAMALTAVGGHRKAVKQIRAALGRRVDSWTTGIDFESSDIYSGSVAKAVVLAQTIGANPRSFGGVNLVRRLNGRVSSTPGIAGRIQDKSSYGDYANTLGQAFAAGGLTKAHSAKAPAAVGFLLKQQCAAGYFRLNFAAAGAKDQTCGGAAKKDRAPDTDATALAIINLQSIKNPSPRVKRAIANGTHWLVRHQARNGSFGGGPTTQAPNTNSTGLAAWALGQAGKCKPAQRAARWVTKLELRNGAVAYDVKALRTAKRDGITATTADQWRRASAQAAPGLVYLAGCQAR
jgi:hypothetical protein